MSVPEEVARLLAERDEARKARDFARADALRGEIESKGFLLKDTPRGAEVEPKPRFEALDPKAVPSFLEQPPLHSFSVHLLYEGWIEDVTRFLAALEKHPQKYEVILVDNASADGEALEGLRSERVNVLHLTKQVGWAEARNLGLGLSRGEIVVVADLSIEPAADCLSPLAVVLQDPTIGVAGPFGVVSQDLREFEEAPGAEADAIEGYLMAFRRELLTHVRFDEKFKWYRNADIDLSFQIRALGLAARVVPLEVARHEHRGWFRTPVEERAKWSKRNFYRFLDRWKHREDLLISKRA